jgi:AbrB family looped-hinge helix DNA binding protein
MDIAAKITSKGQITLPKAVREQLELAPGDRVLFRLAGDRAVLARTPNFLDLAGAVPVPPEKRGASWDEIRRKAWRARGKRIDEQR